MKPVIGVYLGWIPPDEKAWEPLYRTVRTNDGYKTEPTQLLAPTIARYPGLKEVLAPPRNPSDLPYTLRKRTPLIRPDYERNARTLNLPYPIVDLFEYIGRTGGQFSGDPFTVCPIVEPDEDGKYTYEFGLWKVDNEVANNLNSSTQFKAIANPPEAPIVTVKERRLGEFSPHFSQLENTISNINLVNIGEQDYSGGGQIIISFDTSTNLYETPSFALASQEVAMSV